MSAPYDHPGAVPGTVPGEFGQSVQVSTTLGEFPYIIHPQSTDRVAAVELFVCGDTLALVDCVVDVQFINGGEWHEGYLDAGDFIAGPLHRLLWVSEVMPQSAAVGSPAAFIMRCGGARAIRIRLKADAGGIVKIRGRLRP